MGQGYPPKVPPVASNHRSPIALLDAKVAEWKPRWQRDQTVIGLIKQLYTEIRTDALLEDARELTLERMTDQLGRSRASRAVGLDGISNQDMRHAPVEAVRMLCEILNVVVKSLVMPDQWLVNVAQLIPKPKGGDRPITVTSTAYSLVMAEAGIDMNVWQEDQTVFWDDAVKGSSPPPPGCPEEKVA